MTTLPRLTIAALLAGGLVAPAMAQYPTPYPSPYPQTYPPGYAYQGQGYNNGYNNGGIGQIVDQLLGNRYNVTDRSAVSRCASAAVAQAQARYAPNGYNQGYNQQGYGYQNQGYQSQGYANGQGYNRIRVTAITNVERRSNGLRVRGLLDTRGGVRNGYQGQGYNGYQGQNYNNGYANGDLTFRCNVDYRGVVTNVRIERNSGYRPY